MEYKEQIRQLNSEGKSAVEIGQILGKTGKTIGYHIRNMGLVPYNTKKIDGDKFIEMWNQGKTDEEIALHFNMAVTSVRSYRTKGDKAGKYNIIHWFSQIDNKLSEIQEQMILGSLLGDLSCSKRSKNARLDLVHGIKQKDYFMKKVEILGDFMGAYKQSVQKEDKRTGKCYEQMRGNSKQHPIFNDIYHLVYKDKKRTVTQEWLDKINHPIALAYWFMDDGDKTGVIATMSFSEEENELLKEWLFNKWGIIASVNFNKSNGYYLRILQKTRAKFNKLIEPYIVDCLKYKIE